MPVPGTNSHPWRYQWSRSRAVHYGVRYGSNEGQEGSQASWSHRHRALESIMINLYRLLFTIHTSWHYVSRRCDIRFNWFHDYSQIRDPFVLGIFVIRLLWTMRLLLKPGITAENGLLLLLLLLLLSFAIVIGLCYELMSWIQTVVAYILTVIWSEYCFDELMKRGVTLYLHRMI
jgi:hypothetical protein